jgi:hypothetical protein
MPLFIKAKNTKNFQMFDWNCEGGSNTVVSVVNLTNVYETPKDCKELQTEGLCPIEGSHIDLMTQHAVQQNDYFFSPYLVREIALLWTQHKAAVRMENSKEIANFPSCPPKIDHKTPLLPPPSSLLVDVKPEPTISVADLKNIFELIHHPSKFQRKSYTNENR